MRIDIEQITQIISDVAEEEIMPRFQKLAAHEIMEKSPGDVVTAADIKAEESLTKRLLDLYPNTVVVGEEACAKDPSTLKLLEQADPVWIIDPVDGTRNFSEGNSVFASMVALVRRGELLASWIHDPARSRTAVAEKGAGAELSGQKLQAASDISALERMTVCLKPSHRRWLEERANDFKGPIPRMAPRFGSAAHDYIALAAGESHCAQFRRLNPWDHAPGILLFREAGGYDAMIPSRQPYEARPYGDEGLLLTPNELVWDDARKFLNPPDGNLP